VNIAFREITGNYLDSPQSRNKDHAFILGNYTANEVKLYAHFNYTVWRTRRSAYLSQEPVHPMAIVANFKAITKGFKVKVEEVKKKASKKARRKQVQKDQAQGYINSIPRTTTICNTDGSAYGNPGPTGAGVHITRGGEIIGEQCISIKDGTNNIGELMAIGLALAFLIKYRLHEFFTIVTAIIMTDSKYAMETITGVFSPKSNRKLILRIKKLLNIASKDMEITFHWVPAHTGLEGNEKADELAKLGADGARRHQGVDPASYVYDTHD
jgi:ribonuclease HI